MNLQKEKFSLSFVCYETINGSPEVIYIPFSFYENEQSGYGSFNEKLSEKDNSQFSLTFSMALKYDDRPNIFLNYLVIDREIRLDMNGEIIDFVITNISPSLTSKNAVYNFTCQDSFSFYHSKQNNNINISTDDETLWIDGPGPKTIQDLVEKVLELSYSFWKLDNSLNNAVIHFPDNLYSGLGEMKVSLELTNTTPYNALVEISKLFNATIRLDYKNKIIYFINKETLASTGFMVRPDINLSNFSYSENGSNLYNIMHITGGEDSDGNYVSILPAMPFRLASILIETQTVRSTPEQSDIYTNPSFYTDGTDVYVRENNSYRKMDKIVGDRESENEPLRYLIKWTEANSNEELSRLILHYYNNLPVDERNIADENDIKNFFAELRFMPHAASFLWDFTYWEQNGLLSKERHVALKQSLTKDYRNINLLLMAYQLQYNFNKYELEKIIRQEEELIAVMASEDNSRACLTNEQINPLDSYYLSYCTTLEKETYLPIGWIKNNQVQYGSFADNQNIYMTLPDLSNLSSYINNIYVLDTINNKVLSSCYISSINNNLNIINCACSYQDVIAYIRYEDIKSMSLEFLNVEDNVDGAIELRILNAKQQLAALHGRRYYYLHESLYGKNWLENRVNDLSLKISQYTDKYFQLEQSIIQKFGTNWRLLNSESFGENYELYSELSYLTSKLNTIQMEIGGLGSRKKSNGDLYTYKGKLNYYYDVLYALLQNYNSEVSMQGLETIIKQQEVAKESWLKVFYSNYHDIIRETKYEDSNQLTSRGLYLSAEKQFMTYKQPTKSYSSSVITSVDLYNSSLNIKIGENISLIHPSLNLKEVPNEYDIYFENYIPSGAKKVFINDPTISNHVNEAEILIETDNFIRIKTEKWPGRLQVLFVDGKYYRWQGDYKLLLTQPTKQPEKISLKVTGITKDLRSDVSQLTVQENTLYNTLIDRLLVVLK